MMDRPDHPYASEKDDSERLDREYGFDIEGTEREVRRTNSDAQTWAHLSAQIFQTPYAELERIIEETDPERSLKEWADLGCAYGRLGIVLSKFRPEATFVGIEIAGARVEEARRIYRKLGLDPKSLRSGDLTKTPLPDSDVYFIYDFGHRAEILDVLEKLREIARRKPIRVVGRGRAIRDLVEREHPWLGAVHPPIHRAHYSIYFS